MIKNKVLKLNKNEILEFQKNRDPYLMIDEATEVIPGVSAKGFKELKNELNFVLEKLKKIGFIKAEINQIQQIENAKYEAEFSLKNQIKNIYVFGMDSIALKDYKNYTKIDNKKTLILPIEKVENFYEKVLNFLKKVLIIFEKVVKKI